MPNGRNAGRLFPDCENRYGYGESHAFKDPIAPGETATRTCIHCGRRLKVKNDAGRLVVVRDA